jgi:outer membrane protein OmpA-like peptidoglycan-associated protein/uncharacterized protein YidB (DUF937 family)
MGVLDAVLTETEGRLGLSPSKTSTLLSGFLSIVNEQAGGLGGLLDRFRQAGVGSSVSSWISGAAKAIPTENVELALGNDTIQKLANKSGLSFAAASSALGLMIPMIVQRLAPGGVVPTHLPADIKSYITGPTAAIASRAREATWTTEKAVQSGSIPRSLWAFLALTALLLIGIFFWNSRRSVSSVAFNAEEQIRLASQKAYAALAGLKPGFTTQDMLGALNLQIINFSSGSAQIPGDDLDFLNKTAVAMKASPANAVIEIGGHTDATGDPDVNMRLSQQRADAVRDYLVSQGVSSAKLIAKGYGDTKPIASNDTEEGKFHNRRIEFTLAN